MGIPIDPRPKLLQRGSLRYRTACNRIEVSWEAQSGRYGRWEVFLCHGTPTWEGPRLRSVGHCYVLSDARSIAERELAKLAAEPTTPASEGDDVEKGVRL